MMAYDLKNHFDSQGYVAPLRIIGPEQAATHRAELEQTELDTGPLHYRFKIHTVMQSPYELATHATLLNAVEQLIGPDILLYGVTYIIKEPHSQSHVSWHQDLTYWGLSSDAQVSAWLALSPATEESGCMFMVPGSHRDGMHQHQLLPDNENVLLSSQTVTDVDTDKALPIVLQAGEASLHHGWTLHTSMPNRSDDRRIGLNIQYIRPDMRQTKMAKDSALLVRGVDHYGHFAHDKPAEQRFDRKAWLLQNKLQERITAIQGDSTLAEV